MTSSNEPNHGAGNNSPGDPSDARAGGEKLHNNPYEPPRAHVSAPVGDHNQLYRPMSSSVPGAEFWIAAGTSIGFAILATYFTQGMTFPIVIALIGGIIRVCLIYWRRSARGLSALPAISLLITSTPLVLALVLACAAAFCGICIGGLAAMGVAQSEDTGPIVWSMISGVISFATFVFFFAWSIKWAS